ncbi:unnamed protein product, partial [Prorocentrum cordatum]
AFFPVRLSDLFLGTGGRFRPFVERFGNGEDVDKDESSDAEALLKHVASFLFLDVVERSIEGRHSVVHRFSVFRPSKLCMLSNRLRVPEIEMLLPLEPPMFAELIECMRLARRPRHLARELGIMGHPSLQELDGRRGFRRGMKRYIWMQQ